MGKIDYNNTLIIDNLERKIGDDYKKCDLFYRHLSVSDDDLRINGSDIFKVLQVAVKSKMKKDIYILLAIRFLNNSII